MGDSTVERRAATWIAGDDTGLSSITLWAVMMGVPCARPYSPYDRWDRGRCYRLLRLIPEWIPRLDGVRAAYPGHGWEHHLPALKRALAAETPAPTDVS